MVTKKALLVGCNYPGQGSNELTGCCNDARRMHALLKTRFGFPEENIDLLVDDGVEDPPSSDVSTRANIVSYLDKLIEGVESEDVLVFYFSGHGGLLERSTDNTGWNEAIYPNEITNPITDDDIRMKVSQIPAGVNFTFISDSCCSGGLIEELKEQVGGAEYGENFEKQLETFEISQHGSKRTTLRMLIQALNDTGRLEYTVDETNYRAAIYELHQEDASLSVTTCQHGEPRPQCCKAADVGVLLSGCESWELSINSPGDDRNPEPHGVFTVAVEDVAKGASQALTNREMVDAVRALIEEEWAQKDHEEGEEPQHPALYCSDANVDKVFICDFVEAEQ